MSRAARPRILLDATPLLGQRTGIGRYTENLLAGLARRDDLSVAATAFTLRGWRDLAGAVPSGVSAQARPFPARALRAAWRRTDLPRVEWLAGRADVVHGTNFILPPSHRAASVVTVHDLVWHTHKHTMRDENRDLEVLVRRALRRAGAVCTLAEVTRARIAEEFGYPAERIFVTPPGVGPDWFDQAPLAPEVAAAHDLPERYFVFVGTREPRKGLDTLLAAYGSLRSRVGSDCPDLLLVGPQGWGTDHAGGADDGVRLAGYLPQSILPAVVAGSLGLVLPSVDEGFGMTAVEALATGVPVITSALPVLTEVTGPVGMRFPVGDAPSLADCLFRLLDPVATGAVEREARVAWAQGYTWEKCTDATVRAYRCALGSA